MAGDNDGLVAEWKRDSNQASTKCERKLGVTDQPEQTNDAFFEMLKRALQLTDWTYAAELSVRRNAGSGTESVVL